MSWLNGIKDAIFVEEPGKSPTPATVPAPTAAAPAGTTPTIVAGVWYYSVHDH